MLRAYAAWAENAAEVDIEAIRRALTHGPKKNPCEHSPPTVLNRQ
jgi:hypothetical protein